jgi:hypothetical protein
MPAELKKTNGTSVQLPPDEWVELVIERAVTRAIERHTVTCPIADAVVKMSLDIYGPDGQKESHPGVMGRISDLERSRGMARIGLRTIWAILLSSPIIAWLNGLFGVKH